jgi:hypothetical protein
VEQWRVRETDYKPVGCLINRPRVTGANSLENGVLQMKKILGILVVIAFCSSTFAARAGIKIAGNAANSRVANISVITLGKCIGDTTTLTGGDSLDAAGVNTYGPYRLSVDDGRGMFTSFQAYCNAGAIASGDSLQLTYQIIAGNTLADTNSTWTAVDTLIAGKKGIYTDISSRAGQAIVFRINNVDATGVLIAKKIRVVLKETYTAQGNTR